MIPAATPFRDMNHLVADLDRKTRRQGMGLKKPPARARQLRIQRSHPHVSLS
jgi:hypothetical protein